MASPPNSHNRAHGKPDIHLFPNHQPYSISELNPSDSSSNESINTDLEMKRMPRNSSKVTLNIDGSVVQRNALSQSCSTTSEDSGVQESLDTASIRELDMFKKKALADEDDKEADKDFMEKLFSSLSHWYRLHRIWFLVLCLIGYNVFFGFAVHKTWHRVSIDSDSYHVVLRNHQLIILLHLFRHQITVQVLNC